MKKDEYLKELLERAVHIEAHALTIDMRTESLELQLADGSKNNENQISTIDDRIRSIEERLAIMDNNKLDEIRESLKELKEKNNQQHTEKYKSYNIPFERNMQQGKVYQILVWGTEGWAENLVNALPVNCIVNAFVDLKPQKESFLGINVISEEEFVKYYAMTDLTIIASEDYSKIQSIIGRLMSQYNNVYICRGEYGACKYVDNMSVGTWIPLVALFQEKSNNIRKMALNAPYTLCDCNEVQYVINSKYKIMIHDLSYDINYQQNDIELFIELSKKYYEIASNSTGYFMDIGANIGTTSIWVKKKINPNLKLIAIEALKENCKQYKCNCILNDIEETEYVLTHAAVSNEEKEMELMQSEDNLGDNRLYINGNLEKDKKLENVQTICLDKWIKRQGIESKEIMYIWMDVQAHEAFAIEGGFTLFKNNAIPLFMEFWPSELKKNNSLERLVQVLMKCYKGFINVEWYKKGDQKVYEIQDLYKVAEENPDKSFDLFMIK